MTQWDSGFNICKYSADMKLIAYIYSASLNEVFFYVAIIMKINTIRT